MPTCWIFILKLVIDMGARMGQGKGALDPGIWQNAAVQQNTVTFLLASSALAVETLYFSLKRREKTQKFSFTTSARQNLVVIIIAILGNFIVKNVLYYCLILHVPWWPGRVFGGMIDITFVCYTIPAPLQNRLKRLVRQGPTDALFLRGSMRFDLGWISRRT